MGQHWKLEIFISKLTVWKKLLLTNPNGENNNRFNMRGGQQVHSERKGEGGKEEEWRGDGQRGA